MTEERTEERTAPADGAAEDQTPQPAERIRTRRNPARAESLVREFGIKQNTVVFQSGNRKKYVEDESGRLVRVPAGASGEPAHTGHAIHLPSPSFWPIVVSLGFPMLGYGVLYSWWLVGAGAAVIAIGLVGWALEPSVAE